MDCILPPAQGCAHACQMLESVGVRECDRAEVLHQPYPERPGSRQLPVPKALLVRGSEGGAGRSQSSF